MDVLPLRSIRHRVGRTGLESGMEAEGSQAPARGNMSDVKPETGETPH